MIRPLFGSIGRGEFYRSPNGLQTPCKQLLLERVGGTKIVATLGPASGGEAVLRELVCAGADVFRLNLSHGTREEHRTRIRALCAIREVFGIHVSG